MVSKIQAETATMPELLDTTLRERKMKAILALLLLVCLVAPAYAFTIPFTNIKVLEKPDPVYNKTGGIWEEPQLEIGKFYEEKSFIDVATRIIGITNKGERNLTLLYNNETLAVLPPGSKFMEMPVHKYCLKYQYGTEQWFTCEQENFL